jgi:hypothetical protein
MLEKFEEEQKYDEALKKNKNIIYDEALKKF